MPNHTPGATATMSNRQHGHTTPIPDGALSHRASRWIAITAAVTVIILALCAAILSYVGLKHLAAEAGFQPWATYLFPIVIDGLTLVGSLGVVYSTLSGLRVWYPWCLLGIGVCASVAGNVAASPSDDLVSRLVHAAPPLALALALEEMLRVFRHRAGRLSREQTVLAQSQAEAEQEQRDAELAREQAAREHEIQMEQAALARVTAEQELLEAQTTRAAVQTDPEPDPAPHQTGHAPETERLPEPAPSTVASPNRHQPPTALTPSGPDSDTAPAPTTPDTRVVSKKDRIRELLAQNPDASVKSIAKQAGTSQQYVRNVKATILKESDNQAPLSSHTPQNARKDAQDALTGPNRGTAPSTPETAAQPHQDAAQGAGVQPAREPIPAGSPVPDPVAAQIQNGSTSSHPNGHQPNRGSVDPFAPFPVTPDNQGQAQDTDAHSKIPEPIRG